MEACGIRKGSLRENKRSAIMADIKWIKISCDIFNDEAIKLIEQMPDGDAIIVIWLKLLITAGKINDNGYLYFNKYMKSYQSSMKILIDLLTKDESSNGNEVEELKTYFARSRK